MCASISFSEAEPSFLASQSPADVGVLFVHGIGRHVAGSTLEHMGGALATYVQQRFSLDPNVDVRMNGQAGADGETEETLDLAIRTSSGPARIMRLREARWEGSFEDPTIGEVVRWGLCCCAVGTPSGGISLVVAARPSQSPPNLLALSMGSLCFLQSLFQLHNRRNCTAGIHTFLTIVRMDQTSASRPRRDSRAHGWGRLSLRRGPQRTDRHVYPGGRGTTAPIWQLPQGHDRGALTGRGRGESRARTRETSTQFRAPDHAWRRAREASCTPRSTSP